jgi:hypothetical protein
VQLRLKELAMPDLDQIKQVELEARDRRRRFAKGRSGNSTGRPRGCRDHVRRAARLLVAGEGEALTPSPAMTIEAKLVSASDARLSA